MRSFSKNLHWRFRIFAAGLVLMAVPSRVPASDLDAWRQSFSARLDQSIAQHQANPGQENKAALAVTWGDRNGSVAASAVTSLLGGPGRENRFPVLASILRENGLPPGLMEVAAVESGFNPAALSPKGALGLWQLMPATARRYGLEVSAQRDERSDPVRSTYAAASYMKDLYAQFGDWPLTLAAYNAGEDRVQQALNRFGALDFWTLSARSALPEETRRYVPAVLARMDAPLVAPITSVFRGNSPRADFGEPELYSNRASAQIVYATPAIPSEPSNDPSR